MTLPTWLLLSLAAVILWSVSAVLQKFLRTNHIKNPQSYLIFGIPVTFLSLLLLFFGTFELTGVKDTIISILTGIFASVGYYIYLIILQREEVSKTITIYGMIPAVVLLLATIFLGERLNILQGFAFILILFSVFLISYSGIKKGFTRKKDIFLLLLSVLLFSLQTFSLKLIQDTNYTTLMILRQIPFLILTLILLSIRGNYKIIREDLKKLKFRDFIVLIFAEAIGFLGIIFLYIAVQNGSVSLVSLIEGSQCIITMMFCVFLTLFFPKIINEDLSKKALIIKISSIILMFGGIAMLAIS